MNYILKNENSIYYECGYSNDNSIFLSIENNFYLFTDGRYSIEAKESTKNINIIISRDIILAVKKIIKKSKIKKIYFDPKEWSVFEFNKISTATLFKAKIDFSHKKRIIKEDYEIKLLKKAVSLGSNAFDKLAKEIDLNGYGLDEYRLTDIASSILSNSGSYQLSFDPIVALNHNSAKPHAMPTSTKLKKGDTLLVDAGLKYKRYCSDRTRTAFIKDEFNFNIDQKFKQKKIQKAYDCVLKAHDVAISKARSGMKANKIDALARDVITKAGFGKYFVHSTGHGVGLDIHEMPYISSRSKTKIEDNMVYTIEPGIYIPNEFGIRIEDMVVMKDSKAVVL